MKAALCAVLEKASGELVLISPDCLHDLAPANADAISSGSQALTAPAPQEQERLEKWLKVKIQVPMVKQEQQQRQRELDIRQDYLKKAMESAIRDSQTNQMKLAAKVAAGDETYRVARDSAQKRVKDLQERYRAKQNELDYLKIVSFGRVAYLGCAIVHPAPALVAAMPGMKNDPEVEAFAMRYVMQYERQRGWEPEDVSQN